MTFSMLANSISLSKHALFVFYLSYCIDVPVFEILFLLKVSAAKQLFTCLIQTSLIKKRQDSNEIAQIQIQRSLHSCGLGRHFVGKKPVSKVEV